LRHEETAVTAALPALGTLDAAARDILAQRATRVQAPAASFVFQTGEHARAYLLVLSGSVRVQRLGETGREIVLYRVEAGESCVLTTAGLLSGGTYEAEARTEGEVEALALPAEVFHTLLDENASFRNFVFRGFSQRLADLLLLVEEVAFGKLDVRLAEWLVRFAPRRGPARRHAPGPGERAGHRPRGGQPAAQGVRAARLGAPGPRPHRNREPGGVV
jgi:CRP/FNR family transcriptional regulator